MIDPFVQRPVTYTYTSPSGAVIVIQNVPAEIYRDERGREEILYRIDVAERLDDLVNSLLPIAKPGAVERRSFDDRPTLPDVDYEVQFSGPDMSFEHASVQTWRLIFDKTYNAFKAAIKSVSDKAAKASDKAFPTVAFVGPTNSIVVGVRTTEQVRLFDLDYKGTEVPDKALRLLLATSRWLDGEGSLPPDIEKNDGVVETLLRAVEELSPTDDATKVSLAKVGEDATAFTRQKRDLARQRRIQIKLRSSETQRPIEVIGKVSRLDEHGAVRLRDIHRTPDFNWRSSDSAFEPDLLNALLENFGHLVRVSALQERTPSGWSRTLEIVDVVRYDERPVAGTDNDRDVTIDIKPSKVKPKRKSGSGGG
jgi:hypothetical protein